MRYKITELLITALIMIFAVGCSGINDPVQPPASDNPEQFNIDNLPVQSISKESNSNHLLGTWDIEFNLDTLDVEATRHRDMSQHFNVTSYIPAPEISVVAYNPLTGVIDVDVTVTNSSSYNAFDLRLILFTDNDGVRLLNADAWTSMWDIPGGSLINPFIAYAKSIDNRQFGSQTQHAEHLQVYLPAGVSKVTWAIDASFPDNCHEPYSIDNFTQNRLGDIAGNKTEITVEIRDWQNDVSSVSLYCPAITGETLTPFSHDDDYTWEMDLFNNTGAHAGIYSGVIIATSSEYSIYDFVSITVSEQTVAKWTIFLYFWDADLTDWVSVNVNEMEVVGGIEDELNLVLLREEDLGLRQYIMEIIKDPEGYNGEIISPEIDDHGEVIKPGGVNMGDPQTLTDFLNWGIDNYPAERYGLILFGHGSGPFSVVPDPPWLSFVNGMQVWTLRDAVQAVLDVHPEIDKLEFLHFESCLMGWYETVYGLTDVTKIGVASEMVESGYTAEYTVLLTQFVDNLETWEGRDFSATYVDTYLEYAGMGTLAAWETELNETVIKTSLNNFAQELMDALPANRSEIESCREEAGDWGAWCADPECTDLGYFCEIVMSRVGALPSSLIDAAEVLRNNIDQAVYHHGHWDDGEVTSGCFDDETGWQIWFPRDYDDPKYDGRKSNYASLGIDSLLWDDFLDAYDS